MATRSMIDHVSGKEEKGALPKLTIREKSMILILAPDWSGN